MNMRNGIPIVQSVKKTKQPQGRLWKAIPNPFTKYIELFMTVDKCEVSIIMPYDFEWIQQYLNEGWIELGVWDVDERRNA
ncbi:Uncharacterised protein [Lysinibacillus capsici]|uniref:Uncharacterized protein n=1 Tax=Lysinibacillus capsici TaxID=2115968 RepID=A0A2X1AI38_9BACI|nr:hypothetical protein [Lysinibacillus capsici]SPU37894.1 Uncharacterised protein [Lysinibacillus capsici]